MNENQFELAQKIEEAARKAGIEEAHRACAGKGSPDCVDCDEPISAKRRAAVPYAKRCAECQTTYERERKNGR